MTDDLPLRTTRLVLRPFVPADAGDLLRLSHEEVFRRWLPSQVYADEAEARSVLDVLIAAYAAPGHPARGPYVLAVDHAADGCLIGHVGLSPLDGDVEVGFAIARSHQRRGLAIEALAAASRWACARFDLARIVAVTAEANEASRRTLVQAGFLPEDDRVMTFQGVDQPVAVYALPAALR